MSHSGHSSGIRELNSSWSPVESISALTVPWSNVSAFYRTYWQAGSRVVEMTGELDAGADQTGVISLFTGLTNLLPVTNGVPTRKGFVLAAETDANLQTGVHLLVRLGGVFEIRADAFFGSGVRYIWLDQIRFEFRSV